MERLVDVLATVVRTPAGAPLAPETIVIQSQGMERWLSNQLALRLGIFANARFPFPRSFIEEVFELVAPAEGPPGPDYSRELIAFSVLALLDELLPEPAFAALRSYLEDAEDELKRFQLAERVAYAFDQYLVYRPRMILKWEKGMGSDWQARLWRRVREHLGGEHFARRAERFFKNWSPLLISKASLPRRVSIVGLSALPPIYLKVFDKLAELCDVQLFLLSPSAEYFAQVRSLREVVHARRGAGDLEFDDRALEALQGNPLLASLGRAGRQFQFVLERDTLYRETAQDLFSLAPPITLLEKLQQDIVTLRDHGLSDADRHQVSADDASIAVHVCHSPMREVEVLRDQLLGMLEADRSLEPGDVLVMSPDIDMYAPLVDAVFGVEPDNRLYLPYRIADRRQRSSNLCARAILQVLSVVQGRMTASEVLDLLQLEPVRRKFAIEAGDLNVLQNYVHEAGIRWGIDAQHRARLGQPAHAKNTWRFGLERLLLGVALPASAEGLCLGSAPVDDMEGEATLLVGKLAEFLAALCWAADEAGTPKPISGWMAFLDTLIERVLDTDDSENWQRTQLFEVTQQIGKHAREARFEVAVSLTPVLEALTHRFETERVSHQFLSGGVTFCAMLPMRSIPFRVVALLGMNDGQFPRVQKAPSFDLLSAAPEVGDRSTKDEDRYMFLEAILCARQHLLLSYVGRGVQDNAQLPPSPVVSELLEYVAAAFRVGDEPAQVVVEHPLQPFSPRYFGRSGEPLLFSFADSEARGAEALRRKRALQEPFVTGSLAVIDSPGELELDQLIRFFQNPARGFLQNRLGVYLADDPRLVEDREPLELGALERHELGQMLLDQLLLGGRGPEPAATETTGVEAVIAATGFLPHGTPGSLVYRDVLVEAQQIAERVARWAKGPRQKPVRLEIPLAAGALLAQLTQVYSSAQVYWQYARVKPKNELSLWLRHLALSAAKGGAGYASVLLGRRLEDAQPETATCIFEPLPVEDARRELAFLVDLFRLGHQQPLPIFPAASKIYVQQLIRGKGPPDAARALSRARDEFSPSYGNAPCESEDPYVARVFAGLDPLAAPVESHHSSLGRLDFSELSKRIFVPLLRFRRSDSEA